MDKFELTFDLIFGYFFGFWYIYKIAQRGFACFVVVILTPCVCGVFRLYI